MTAVMEHVNLDVNPGLTTHKSDEFTIKGFGAGGNIVGGEGQAHGDFKRIRVHRPGRCGTKQ